MPYFEYKVTDREGKTSVGRGEAASREAMSDSLVNSGYFVIDLKEIQVRRESVFSKSFLLNLFRKGVSQKEITYFYMQLSTLIGAGVTLVESLESLADQCENQRFKAVIMDVRTRISTGQSFFEAISRHPDVFSDLAANMIKAGETGAGLEEVLVQIAKFSERDTKIRAKTKSALIYPAILCALATGVIVFLITYVFPKFTKVFARSKAALPLPTVALMNISAFMQSYIGHIIIIIIAMFIGTRWLIRTNPAARAMFDRFILKVPIFGDLILKSSIARFARTLGTLLTGGVPILKSLDVCESIIENVVLKNVVSALKLGVSQGLTLYDVLKTRKIFPSIITKIIQTGEKTGALPRLLIKSAEFFEYEVEIAIEGLMTIIEPVLIIVMGAAIGFIAMAMFLPMFDLTTTIK